MTDSLKDIIDRHEQERLDREQEARERQEELQRIEDLKPKMPMRQAANDLINSK